MRIGLLRHFPVCMKFPTGLKTVAELQAWRESYDLADTTVGKADLGGVAWQACISSDLPRAYITASALFPGQVQLIAMLREPRFAQLETGNLRLPVWVWQWVLWLCWMTGHQSQRACRDEFRQRVCDVADELSALDQDTLVVSHAGIMAYLSSELRRRGFVGPKLRIAKHATAYVFEKTLSGPAAKRNEANATPAAPAETRDVKIPRGHHTYTVRL